MSADCEWGCGDEIAALRAENEQLREAVNRQHGEPIDEVYAVDGLHVVAEQLRTYRRDRDEARAEADRLRVTLGAVQKAIESAVRDGMEDVDVGTLRAVLAAGPVSLADVRNWTPDEIDRHDPWPDDNPEAVTDHG